MNNGDRLTDLCTDCGAIFFVDQGHTCQRKPWDALPQIRPELIQLYWENWLRARNSVFLDPELATLTGCVLRRGQLLRETVAWKDIRGRAWHQGELAGIDVLITAMTPTQAEEMS